MNEPVSRQTTVCLSLRVSSLELLKCCKFFGLRRTVLNYRIEDLVCVHAFATSSRTRQCQASVDAVACVAQALENADDVG